MEEKNQEIAYDGFVTPSLILDKSDKEDRGRIVDKYSRTKDQVDGLICGTWSRGFEDGLIHIYLSKPVAAICDERKEWVAKKTLLKEPISYAPLPGAEIEAPILKQKATPAPKRQVVLDPVTKQFKML